MLGTEKLTDIATTLDIKVSRYNKNLNKQTFGFELGVDSYTSASSDNIDPSTITSASYQDVRVYPSLNYTVENEEKGQIFSTGISTSAEYDYFQLEEMLVLQNFQKIKTENYL